MPEMMPFSLLLWPILLSTVFVFIASSLAHMVLPWHKSDYPSLPDEDAFRKAVGPMNIPPGDYFVPRPAGREEMKSPEFMAKVNGGPRVIMTVLPNGMQGLGPMLGSWFVYCLVTNFFAGHIAQATVAPGAPNNLVAHTVGLAAFMGYVFALWQGKIWFGRSWSYTIKATVDGLIYAVITAATFVWLWPK